MTFVEVMLVVFVIVLVVDGLRVQRVTDRLLDRGLTDEQVGESVAPLSHAVERRAREDARSAGQRADDREADMQAARDGYNPNW